MFGDLLKTSQSSGEPPIDLSEGLVNHFLLNNNSDDCHGDSEVPSERSTSYDGEAVTTVASTTNLNGSYIDTDISLSANQARVTVSMWVRIHSTPSSYQAAFGVDRTLTGDDRWIVIPEYVDNRIICDWYTNTNRVEALYDTNLHGTMAHIVHTVNETEHKLYLNGVLMDTTAHAGLTMNLSQYPLFIGGLNAQPSQAYGQYTNSFGGDISNVRIYHNYKEQDFITALFEEGYYPKPLPLPTTVGLVAHYPLTGTAEDTTGNYDGTEVGNTYVDDAEFGSVASFDGVNDYISTQLSVEDFPNNIVFSGFVKINTTTTDTPIVFEENIGNSKFQIYFTSGNKIYVGGRANSGDAYSLFVTTALNSYVDGEWFYLTVYLIKNGSQSIYINNIDVTALTPVTFTGFTQNSATAMIIGGTPVNGMYADINVRNPRFYTALTEQERTDIYNYEKNFRPIDIDDGLVAYYPLAKNSLDNYYNEFDGTDTAITYDGLSGVFNGTTSNISLGNSILSSGDISACGWLKVTSLGGDATRIIVSQDYTSGISNRSFQFNASDTGVNVIIIGTTVSVVQYFASMERNVYYHLAFTYNDSSKLIEIYVNGEKVSSGVATSARGIGQNMLLGARQNSSGTYFDVISGTLSKTRLYNKPIIAEQVEVIYNTEKGDFI